MSSIKIPTPKGFRDLKPEMAKAKREAINKIVSVLEDSGFVPIDTPTIEFADTLKGKYGEEEKLIYEFTDRGGRNLALRYDLTVPLARYVATYSPPLPFRRYQIGQVFRGENPQKGRFREFTQLDFDSVGPPRLAGEAGSSDPKEDALIIAAAIKSLEILGLQNFKALVNDRSIFVGLPLSVIRIIDKIKKIGREGVVDELIKAGYSQNKLKTIESNGPTENLQKIFQELENMGISKDKYEFSPTLARGLDYYTGLIFEMEIEGYGGGSVGGGGRYDNLIGMFAPIKSGFAKKDLPAVGFSFGLDRLLEILYA